jgi:hypothetical protein
VHGLASLLVEGALPLPAKARPDAVRVLTRSLLLGMGCDPRLVPPAGSPIPSDPRRAGGKGAAR